MDIKTGHQIALSNLAAGFLASYGRAAPTAGDTGPCQELSLALPQQPSFREDRL
jgi:hypothetical protein